MSIRIPYAPPEGWIEEDEEKLESEKMMQQEKARWLSGSWKLEPFDSKIPPSERKVEWRRFRDQFQRITDCKMPVDPETKLKGMKIYAGEYLLSILEMQEAAVGECISDIYTEVIQLVNKYFDLTCDRTQERIKFRQMKQQGAECFSDWILRLESQSKFCEITSDQRKEEFLQALFSNSSTDISEKLYEASSYFGHDLNKIIQHGQHLDILRIKRLEQAAINEKSEIVHDHENDVKPVMWINDRKGDMTKKRTQGRYEPYENSRKREYVPRKQVRDCYRCGRDHDASRCPAFRSRCSKCGKVGHWASKCRLSGNEASGDKKISVQRHIAQINKVEK